MANLDSNCELQRFLLIQLIFRDDPSRVGCNTVIGNVKNRMSVGILHRGGTLPNKMAAKGQSKKGRPAAGFYPTLPLLALSSRITISLGVTYLTRRFTTRKYRRHATFTT
jgi:hypothetical protein